MIYYRRVNIRFRLFILVMEASVTREEDRWFVILKGVKGLHQKVCPDVSQLNHQQNFQRTAEIFNENKLININRYINQICVGYFKENSRGLMSTYRCLRHCWGYI